MQRILRHDRTFFPLVSQPCTLPADCHAIKRLIRDTFGNSPHGFLQASVTADVFQYNATPFESSFFAQVVNDAT